MLEMAWSPSLSLEDLRTRMHEFADARDWHQYHTPRNLVLALVGEVGELAEIFQWRGEVAPGCPGWAEADKVHLGEELSDVLLYLVRLADRCNIDLPSAALRKLERNAAKYPADRARGRSEKYTAYAAASTAVETTRPVPAPELAGAAAEGDAAPHKCAGDGDGSFRGWSSTPAFVAAACVAGAACFLLGRAWRS